MARYTATVQTVKPIEEAFAYLSDFSSTEEWDPGVLHAERLTAGPIEQGARFKLRTSFMGSESDLVYEITEIESPRRVVLAGENARVVSVDVMTFQSAGAGTSIAYDADLRLKGLLRFADPLLGLAFRRVGDRALAGLRAKLG